MGPECFLCECEYELATGSFSACISRLFCISLAKRGRRYTVMLHVIENLHYHVYIVWETENIFKKQRENNFVLECFI